MWLKRYVLEFLLFFVTLRVTKPQLKETTCNLQHIDRLSSRYRWRIPVYCERIILHNDSLSDEDGAYLLNAIEEQHNARDNQRLSKGIKVLDLSWNQLGQKTARVLSNLVFAYAHLTDMYIGYNSFSEIDLKLLVDAIGRRKIKNLFRVDLSGFILSDSLVEDLARAMQSNLHFVYLTLDGCDMSTKGISYLKYGIRARRERGVPFELVKGSGAMMFSDYPIHSGSEQFILDSSVRTRSIFNEPSIRETNDTIKGCFSALGYNAGVFDEYDIEDHHGADKLSESDILVFLPNDIKR